MTRQADTDYQRIEKAIRYIQQQRLTQPALEDVAAHVHLSPAHFQKLFSRWAGVSPKKYLQYLTLSHAKSLLAAGQTSLQDAAYASGLSGSSRLHDLFVTIEGMTPGEFKSGGADLTVNYQFADTPFGEVIIAATDKGICQLAFTDNTTDAVESLQASLPNARCQAAKVPMHNEALKIFQQGWYPPQPLKLHLAGTPFQLKIWECLLSIPTGQLTSYGRIAEQIGKPGASRAVGSAIGANPVAYLIPCHRVIQNSGGLGGYRWGETRKSAIIAWESAHNAESPDSRQTSS
ncbi:methylated-DNA--[protein]-cysteine S-methyltransferase [Pseudomaricurvus sp. HS19]|uniref:methylated-DNA--[protein]-cysteine S-methyltransferase n=1 Tax=Pseudomaricurvus sp. HS19 TaxID=2692626 RepID=UPI00136D03E5|nr:methylated-DNA--[protein]-cysteine S-methyltransferase [Pseudomaricurvus sp. HS19]MYM61872.1 methylated-DNA--[protein]-cysteine S-methyltransferase [Pseudomaricurvus sp. HS19]